MIFLYHRNANKQVKVVRNENALNDFSSNLVNCFWQLCEKFPEEIILWIDADLDIKTGNQLENIFQHPLIMASYPVTDYFIPDKIGYVDQLPFVNPNRNVKYPTWRMSTDIGGVFGNTALQFKAIFKGISVFGYLINSIAKIGQQNSLFCYSAPALIQHPPATLKSENKNANSIIFRFTAQHYKKVRLLVLLFCFIKYEHKIPIFTFLKNLFRKSYFRENVDLSEIRNDSENLNYSETIDVIIPTLSRPEHLKNVLLDLKNQEKLPEQVIIVEQNPIENSESELYFIYSEEWPFKIIHHFTHQTGACNARNIALENVKSDWVFFADDDIRFESDLLQKSIAELQHLKIDAININCIQAHEKTVFSKIKQWGSFGSGCSIVASKFIENIRFSMIYEFGYGEDADFGMQLRNAGCDIIYHPDLQLKHLKSQRGGLRHHSYSSSNQKPDFGPKPSPTLMAYSLKFYSEKQLKGYKVSLFLKYYSRQSIKNPFRYIKSMKMRWIESIIKAEELIGKYERKS